MDYPHARTARLPTTGGRGSFGKWAGKTAYWFTFVGLVWGAMSWVASQVTPLAGLGWGTYVFVGLGAACILSLVLSAALVAWRYFNPLSATPAETESETQQIRNDLGTHSQMLFQHGKATEDIHDKLKDMTTTFVNLAKASADDLSRTVDGINKKINATNERIEQNATSIRLEYDRLWEKVFAIRTAHEMRRLKSEIVRLILLLDRPLKQPKDERNWTNWGKRFHRFRSAMHQFESLASAYFPKEAPNLTFVNPSIYRIDDGDFAADQFPDHGTAHDFKTFRQMSSAFESLGSGMLERIEAKT